MAYLVFVFNLNFKSTRLHAIRSKHVSEIKQLSEQTTTIYFRSFCKTKYKAIQCAHIEQGVTANIGNVEHRVSEKKKKKKKKKKNI